ncbi:alcohol oxidase [Meredithblackwellia eburnea MCA 4105]
MDEQRDGILDAIADKTAVLEALKHDFDFVVVGGGTAGLVLANRLSKDPSTSVLVLEAGKDQPLDDKIDIPGLSGGLQAPIREFRSEFYGMAEGNGGRLRRLGAVGKSRMNWEGLLPYFKKSETYHQPDHLGAAGQHAVPEYDPVVHGNKGPLQASVPPYLSPHIQGVFAALRDDMGIRECPDLNGGNILGVGYCPSSIDPTNSTRCTSADAYLDPILAGRENLLVITGALATKIIWAENRDENGEMVAAGVEFLQTGKDGANTKPFRAMATKEVILSAGSIASPQLLELSGVGDSRHLQEFGIETVIDLPGVGENLQDHLSTSITFTLKSPLKSMDDYRRSSTPAAGLFHKLVDDQYNRHHGMLTQAAPVLAFLTPEMLLETDEEREIGSGMLDLQAGNNGDTDLDPEQRAVIYQNKDRSPMIELCPLNFKMGPVADPDSSHFGIMAAVLHPMSRGWIHIHSSDPYLPPAIQPNYLSHPSDIYYLAKGAEFIRSLAQTPTLAAVISEEASPGLARVPEDSKEKGWYDYFRKGNVLTVHHPVGTCAMLPRSKNGVVSPELRLYGAPNVRIVDASIFPLQIAAHTQATVYAVAEKAAAMIIRSWPGSPSQ